MGTGSDSVPKTICEIIRAVRHNNIAIGIQVLNTKTPGGIYNKEGMTWNKGEAVKRYLGSVLQACIIKRDKPCFAEFVGRLYVRCFSKYSLFSPSSQQ